MFKIFTGKPRDVEEQLNTFFDNHSRELLKMEMSADQGYVIVTAYYDVR